MSRRGAAEGRAGPRGMNKRLAGREGRKPFEADGNRVPKARTCMVTGLGTVGPAVGKQDLRLDQIEAQGRRPESRCGQYFMNLGLKGRGPK